VTARPGSAPRVSIVVPVYNVAPYLEACLGSLADQTVSDLEVVMVDDGSTDESPEIAARFAASDGRFRLMRQENRGQGPARNAALDHVAGEFIGFVDGDDVVPPHAYEALLRALDRTGSDFATGAVRRLTSLGTTRAELLGDAFERERLKTHITKFPPLVVDRLACNKLFRRSFWDRHDFRFPEGVRNEDIWVMLPAHYLADSVDVVRDTVYLWRRREGGDLSGSQRRSGIKALRDRARAVDHVSRFLAARGLNEAKLHYDRSVVGNDLRYFLDILETGSDEFCELFLELANDFLDRADPRALEQPLAIERLKWHLVRRRALPELLEVLAFQAEQLAGTPPILDDGRWYGDYPYRTDERLELPRSVFRLDPELAPVARVNALRLDGETLRVEGYAYIELIGAPEPGSQRLELVARSHDGRRKVPFRTEAVHRPDVTVDALQRVASLDWSGFVATLDLGRLRPARWPPRRRRRSAGTSRVWTVGAVLRAGGVERETYQLEPAPLHPVPTVERTIGSKHVQAGPSPSARLEVHVQQLRPVVRTYVLDGGVLQLGGDIGPVGGGALKLNVRRRGGDLGREYPAEPDGLGGRATFTAQVPIEDLFEKTDLADQRERIQERDDGIAWEVHLVGDRGRGRLALHESAPEARLASGTREIAVESGRNRNFRLVARSCRPVLVNAAWSAGALRLEGFFQGAPAYYELVVRSRRAGEALAVPVCYDPSAASFAAEVRPAEIASLAGTRPLAEGQWELLVRPRGARAQAVPVLLDHGLLDRLPLAATIGRKSFRLGAAGYDGARLAVTRDLDPDERGGFRQRRLERDVYQAQRKEEVRDVVLYECFGGREYSDSPRAIHEELLRRDAPFEHLWVVRDGACVPPRTAVAVPELSRDYYEAYARARYVVANDHWPRWALRRSEQIWLQTWHGVPLKRLGLDLRRNAKAVREYRRTLLQPGENWHYLISPGPSATPVLRRAFSETATVLETGLPRMDRLSGPDREVLAEEVRRRLGLPAGRRVLLYAPTYRDHLTAADGYRQGPLLDLRVLAKALADEFTILFRRHRLMVGLPSLDVDGVLDVSTYPDATELLLAVDVLVTDYSSAIFDYATTRRPLLFFTPDLEAYRDEVRGFSIEFEEEAPGPLLRTSGEVVEALRALDAVADGYAERYERFVDTHCALADGRASSRVVESVFDW
jgi:CDP-glycerol glycerophosphotransferase